MTATMVELPRAALSVAGVNLLVLVAREATMVAGKVFDAPKAAASKGLARSPRVTAIRQRVANLRRSCGVAAPGSERLGVIELPRMKPASPTRRPRVSQGATRNSASKLL